MTLQLNQEDIETMKIMAERITEYLEGRSD